MQTKMEIDQRDLDAIERSVRENKERLIRNIVSPVEGFTVNEHMALQDINLPEPNIVPPLQLPPNADAMVNEITDNVLTKISQIPFLVYLNPKQ